MPGCYGYGHRGNYGHYRDFGGGFLGGGNPLGIRMSRDAAWDYMNYGVISEQSRPLTGFEYARHQYGKNQAGQRGMLEGLLGFGSLGVAAGSMLEGPDGDGTLTAFLGLGAAAFGGFAMRDRARNNYAMMDYLGDGRRNGFV